MASDPFAPNASSTAHVNADTDSTAEALHHTLGRGVTQAAAGNHKHTEYPAGPLTTGLLVPASGWSMGLAGGLTLSKYAGMVTVSFYLWRTSDLAIATGVAYTYGVLPVGFRPAPSIPNLGTLGIIKAGGVRSASGAIFDLAGNCMLRAWLNTTILGNSDDFFALNATFPHA